MPRVVPTSWRSLDPTLQQWVSQVRPLWRVCSVSPSLLMRLPVALSILRKMQDPLCNFRLRRSLKTSIGVGWRNVPLFLLGFTASFQHLWVVVRHWAEHTLLWPCAVVLVFARVKTTWFEFVSAEWPGDPSFPVPPLQPSCSPWAL